VLSGHKKGEIDRTGISQPVGMGIPEDRTERHNGPPKPKVNQTKILFRVKN